MQTRPVLIAGEWRQANSDDSFAAFNPSTGERLVESYPVSNWKDVDEALTAAAAVADELRWMPGERIAEFLNDYALRLETNQSSICAAAHEETGLPVKPRLADAELPRTVGQLRQAAEAARSESWRRPVLDTKNQLRSCHVGIGPVAVFGPNNFPLAFGSVSGGDFAAAIAAGNPVIAKAHSLHPATTRLLAELAHESIVAADLPAATVQLLYRLDHADGLRLVSDSRIGTTGYTGGRSAGLKLKAAADQAGKPIFLELSSVNPVVILPGAMTTKSEQMVNEFVTSCLMGAGQFCTNPGLLLVVDGDETRAWISEVAQRFQTAPSGVLLGESVQNQLQQSLQALVSAGARVVTESPQFDAAGYGHANTLLQTSGSVFLADPPSLQAEVFGNTSLVVVAENSDELLQIIGHLEGNLTGTIYAADDGSDDSLACQVQARLAPKVGRLLNDQMPTGVAVSPAMNHGGPFPATGHPGFTAVGVPASLERFSQLLAYDHVRQEWLPGCLRDVLQNPLTWRQIDGEWRCGS